MKHFPFIMQVRNHCC